jgi:hypothetical protein
MYKCDLASPDEAFDINKYLINSIDVYLSNPSAIFAIIDTQALLNWSLNPKSLLNISPSVIS